MSLPAIEQFLEQLESVPWFGNLGQPTPPGVGRMSRWEDWPGPEEAEVSELCEEHQALYDDLLAASGGEQEELSRLWERVHAIVFRVAATKVPYDPKEDAWHAPSSAVWLAAWTAGLVGLCLQTGRKVPPTLEEQWQWYLRGHWPAGYADFDSDDQPATLLVF